MTVGTCKSALRHSIGGRHYSTHSRSGRLLCDLTAAASRRKMPPRCVFPSRSQQWPARCSEAVTLVISLFHRHVIKCFPSSPPVPCQWIKSNKSIKSQQTSFRLELQECKRSWKGWNGAIWKFWKEQLISRNISEAKLCNFRVALDVSCVKQ